MIELSKDLFVHLSISAKALKNESNTDQKFAKPIFSELESSSFESVKPVAVQKKVQGKKELKSIEETIEDVVKNPKIIELKKELEAAERIFEDLKEKEDNPEFIYRIEQKIFQLKRLIDQKNYF
ncbi:MAG: hypothetical protein QXK76_00220 [Candidatus Woesearchaeota archaeon]